MPFSVYLILCNHVSSEVLTLQGQFGCLGPEFTFLMKHYDHS